MASSACKARKVTLFINLAVTRCKREIPFLNTFVATMHQHECTDVAVCLAELQFFLPDKSFCVVSHSHQHIFYAVTEIVKYKKASKEFVLCYKYATLAERPAKRGRLPYQTRPGLSHLRTARHLQMFFMRTSTSGLHYYLPLCFIL